MELVGAYIAGFPAHLVPFFLLFTAAFLQSLTGFGLVIVGAPLLMFFYDPKLVVPIMLMLSVCGNSTQGFLTRKKANYKLVVFLFIGVLLGLPLGFFIFNNLDSGELKIFINVIILLTLSTMQLMNLEIRERPRNSIITGFFSGITSVTAGMAGPPYLIYLAYTRMRADVFRATCFMFFLICNIASLSSYALGGHPLAPAASEFIYLLPALFLGIGIGDYVVRFVPHGFIKKMIFIVLYFTCTVSILQEVLR